jgi:hypothetical protein
MLHEDGGYYPEDFIRWEDEKGQIERDINHVFLGLLRGADDE